MSEQQKSSQNRTGPTGGPRGGPATLGRPVEKAKDFKGTLKRLIGYLSPQKYRFLVVVLLAILSTLFNIFSPRIMGLATNEVWDGIKSTPYQIDFDYIRNIVFLLIGLYVLSAFFNFLMGYLMSGVSQKTVYNMRNDVNHKLGKLPLKYFDGRSHGEILSRITNDLDNVGNTLQQSLTQLITSVVTLVGVTIMMLLISPTLTLITIIVLPLSAMVTMQMAKRSQKLFKARQKSLGELNGHVEEMFTGHRIIKAFGQEKKSLHKFDSINQELFETGWKAEFISGIIMPLLMFVNNLGYVFICVVGGIFVTRGTLEVGFIQAFIQYSRQFTQPIVQTANIANVIQSTVASAERVFELLDETEEISDDNALDSIENPKGQVQFNNVRFGYKEGVPVIKNMNIKVESGQTIAIVGPTGAGKTTLVNLLMRFYEIDSGSIMIDGKDISKIKREELRSMFGMVLQDTWLFNGSIRDNIAYGKRGALEEEILQAAKAAHADHFIRTLPEGYDTILDEEASNISQGQKQLLTIARALLANPRILILDEATSSVDTRTESYIQNAMTRLMEGRTNFVIAHRLSTIREADLILVMNHGDIVEQGTHYQLLEKNGFYADLYNSQFTTGNITEAV